jgi:fructan beta-fructosidase
VLPHIIGANRDPKVIWYEPDHKWVMALYLDGEDFALFSSPNLKQWERLCDVRVEGCSECPEFFALPLDGDQAKRRWVFYGGNGRYLTGDFDGRTFKPDSGPHVMHHGNAFYASQTYNDVPDGRRIVIGWGTVEMPGMPFNQMMDFPAELTLHSMPEGPRLFAQPITEIASLYTKTHHFADVPLPADKNPLAAIHEDLLDIEADFELQGASQVGLHVRGIPVTYHAGAKTLSCLGCSAPLDLHGGKLKLRLIVDRTSIEIFANDGEVYMPVGIIPSDELHGVDVFARGGQARASVAVRELKPIWGK